MGLATFAELKTSIANWLDDSTLTSLIPDFITLAEARFNRELRTPDMEATTTITADAESEDLPANFLGMRQIVRSGSPDVALDYMAPQHLKTLRASGTSGAPTAYTIVDDKLMFAPTPDGSYSVEVSYYARITPLSDSATSNWILSRHPDLYLCASLAAAELYGWNDARASLMKAQADEIIADINAEGNKRRLGSAPLIARGRVAFS
jgi:hypothetical protein